MENKKRTDGKARDENEVQKKTSDRKHQLGMHEPSLSRKQNKMKGGEVEEGMIFRNRNRQGQKSESFNGGSDGYNERMTLGEHSVRTSNAEEEDMIDVDEICAVGKRAE